MFNKLLDDKNFYERNSFYEKDIYQDLIKMKRITNFLKEERNRKFFQFHLLQYEIVKIYEKLNANLMIDYTMKQSLDCPQNGAVIQQLWRFVFR